MPRKGELEFANFICKFGEKELLDVADDMLLPAIFSNAARSRGRSSFFLLNPRVIGFDDGEVGIIFRFVKVVHFSREQVYDTRRGLVPDESEMQSAPSAVALILLSNHRLIYYGETKYAPSLSELRATIEHLLKQQRLMKIRHAIPNDANRLTALRIMRSLEEDLPAPTVHILPLAGDMSLRNVLAQYDIISSVTIRLIETNSTIDGTELFAQLRAAKDSAQSTTTRLQHTNSTGLSKEGVYEQLRPPAEEGSGELVVIGKDPEGNKLKHDNDGFTYRVPISLDGKDPPAVAKQMYEAFTDVMKKGAIKAPLIVREVSQAVSNIAQIWKDKEK